MLRRHRWLSLLLFIAPFVAACDSPLPPAPTVPIGIIPGILIRPTGNEQRLITEDSIPQNNCDGSGEMTQSVEREHRILYTIQLGGDITVDAEGKASIQGIGEVSIGAAVASHYRVGYGREETVRRTVTARAASGSHIQHTIRQYEIWETGELIITAAGAEQSIPYSFRRDFTLEQLPSANVGCPGQAAAAPPTTVPPDAVLPADPATC